MEMESSMGARAILWCAILFLAPLAGCKKKLGADGEGVFRCEKMPIEASRECKKDPPEAFCRSGCFTPDKAFCFSVYSAVTNSRVWICSPTKPECKAWRDLRESGKPSACSAKAAKDLP
jgi:hypothetical protein